jgi:hypothetical protein
MNDLGGQRKSRAVHVGLLAAAAITGIVYSSCNQPHRDCVDADVHKAPDQNCKYPFTPGYRYIYGGSSGGRIGDTVVGGSATEDGVSRGGFGHGGDGAGEGGE